MTEMRSLFEALGVLGVIVALLAGLRVVQFTPLLSRRCVPVRSQEAFHFPDGQYRNEICDVCPFFKLVRGVTQHPFNLG
jgi:hypothetical protein